MRAAKLLLVVAVLVIGGCGLLKKKDADAGVDAAPSASASAEPSATAGDTDAAPPTAALDPNWIPGHLFEENKAKKEITKATYKAELDGLEKEINAEK